MAEQTLKEKTAKGLFWGGISNGVQQVLGVLIGIVLLRNLSPGDYGMVGMLAIFTGIASTIQESGFTAALTNRPEFKAEDYNAVFWFNVFVGSGIYVILFFCAPLIAKFYNQPDLVLLSRVLFLSIVIGALGIAHNAVLFRKLMVKERAKIDIISIALAGIIGIYLAVNGYGYWALAIQTLVFSSFGTILRWIFSPWHPTLTFNFTPVKEMFGFGIKMFLSSIIGQIQANIFSILLGRFNSVNDVGYYSQGTKWSGMSSQFITGMVNSVSQPLFVQIRADIVRLKAAFRKMLRFVSFVCSPIVLGIAFISRDFIAMINVDFLPCVPILQIYCVIALMGCFAVLYGQLCISLERADYYFIISLIFAVIQIVVAFVSIKWGMYILAFSMLFVTFIYLVLFHFYISRLIHLSLKETLKDIFPYFGIIFLAMTVGWIFTYRLTDNFYSLLIKIVLVSLIYIGIVKYSGSIIYRDFVVYLKGLFNK